MQNVVLSKTQQRIFNYIIENSFDACFLSLRELAERAETTETTVLALCKNLGFTGFADFKDNLRDRMKGYCSTFNSEVQQSFIQSNYQGKYLIRDFVEKQKDNFMTSVFSQDLELLQKCSQLLGESNQVFILGHDTSKIPADYLAHRLTFLKVNAWAMQLGSNDTIRGMMLKVTPDDLVIFISLAPYHSPSEEIAKYIKSKGTKILLITDSLDSPVCKYANYTLICKAKAPYIFNTMSAPIAVIELLVTSYAIDMGEDLNDLIYEFMSINN